MQTPESAFAIQTGDSLGCARVISSFYEMIYRPVIICPLYPSSIIHHPSLLLSIARDSENTQTSQATQQEEDASRVK